MTTRPFDWKSVAALLLLALVPASAFAQSTIAGVVRDTSGAVMPGVTVEAASAALIEKVRTVVTNEQGLYRIIDLRPGSYMVTFSLSGFATVRREGIELPPDFTATVNAELRVGALEETITVSGESPIVDIQNTAKSAVFGNVIVEDLPYNRTPQGLAAVIPGVTGGVNTDAVAGRSMTVHGSRPDMNTAIDGMSERRGSSGGAAAIFYMNEGSVQEVSVKLGAGLAEQQMSGVWIDTIAKEGSNQFHGSIIASYADENLASSNLTPALASRGLTAVNALKRTYDFNPNGGGRLMRDKLWFYAAYRKTSVVKYVANSYYDLNPLDWVYTKDFTRPARIEIPDTNYAARFTYQATPRNKFSLSYEANLHYMYQRRYGALVAPEATTWTPYLPNYFASMTWKSPVSNRFYVEAAMASYEADWDERQQKDPFVPVGTISVTEQSTQQVFRSATSFGHNYNNPLTFRSSVSYVTGPHTFKSGFMLRVRGSNSDYHSESINGDMTYSLLDGVPRSITLWATPLEFWNTMNADLGVFVQDSWTLNRLTLNYGLRYDYMNASVPAQHLAAGRFVPARDFEPMKNVPNWHDLNPRLGGAYDVFGNGKTAIKGTLSRYIGGSNPTQTLNPVNSSVSNANRDWTDVDGDFVPDCDFSNPASQLGLPGPNNECGSLSNLNFGKANPNASTWDPDVLNGWGKRFYNWEVSAGIQHELRTGLSVDVGYYRRWYGNFTVTDNTEVTPQDYDPYCLTAPSNDPRLPVAGQRICGFYDVKPEKRGRVLNLTTFSKNFGTQTEVYNGVELTATWRAPGSGRISGGFSSGRTATNNCFVIDSPQQLYNCDVTPPFQTQVKFYAVYPLPWWGIQTSATLQSLPGPGISAPTWITASYVATNAEIRQDLGRNLASGANGTATVELLKPGIAGERVNQVDFRLSKNFTAGGTRLRANLDIYNLFNSSDVQTINTRLSSGANNLWQQPTQILTGRYFKFGTQIDF